MTPFRFMLILTGITVTGAMARGWAIARSDLWYDEAFSGWLIQLPWREFVHRLWGDVHPPFYYLLLRGWAGLWGAGAGSLRGFSVFASSLCPLLAGLMLRSRLGPATALTVAGCLALTPMPVVFGQEARMYALQNLLLILQFLLFLDVLRHGRKRVAGLWLLVTFLFAQTHHLVLFIGLGEAVWVAGAMLWEFASVPAPGEERQNRLGRVLPGAFILLGWLVVGAICALLFFSQAAANRQGLGWMPIPRIADIVNAWLSTPILGGWTEWRPWKAASLVALWTLAGISVWRSTGAPRSLALAALFCYTVFLLATGVVSLLGTRCFFAPRYPVLVAPLAALALGVALTGIKPVSRRVLAGAFLFALHLAGIVEGHRALPRAHIQSLIESIADMAAEGRSVIYNAPHRYPFYRYYLPKADLWSIEQVATGQASVGEDPLFVWQERVSLLPTPDVVNHLLARQACRRMRLLGESSGYHVYFLEEFDAATLRRLWPDRIYVGRWELKRLPSVALALPEDEGMTGFLPFEYEREHGIRYRWSARDHAEIPFRPVGTELAPGRYRLRLCLTAGPDENAPAKPLTCRLMSDSTLLAQQVLALSGARRQHEFEFALTAPCARLSLHTRYAIQPADSLKLPDQPIPEVGYLFFWGSVEVLDNSTTESGHP